MTIEKAIQALKEGKKVLYTPSKYSECFPYESYLLVLFVREQLLYHCLLSKYKNDEVVYWSSTQVEEISGNIFSDDWEIYEGKVE